MTEIATDPVPCTTHTSPTPQQESRVRAFLSVRAWQDFIVVFVCVCARRRVCVCLSLKPG